MQQTKGECYLLVAFPLINNSSRLTVERRALLFKNLLDLHQLKFDDQR